MSLKVSRFEFWAVVGTPSLLIVGALMLPIVSGCGGGASTEPTVKIKRDSSDEEGGGSSSNGGGASKSAAVAEGFGTLKGRVVLQGSSPVLPLIIKAGSAVRDAAVCAAVDLPNERVVVGDGGGVANTFIYLTKAPAGAKESPVPAEPAVFDQKGCKFIPHVFLARTEQQVLIKSSDPIAHNTHTYGKRNSDENLTIEANKSASIVYQKSESEPIEVKCDFHTWMLAYHLPVDHPFASISGPDGSFEIKDLPAGEHTFRVWHEACTGRYINRSLKVTITPDEETTVEIPYPAEKLEL